MMLWYQLIGLYVFSASSPENYYLPITGQHTSNNPKLVKNPE